MIWYGVGECLYLVEALRTLPPTIDTNTAMSAFPPLGFGIATFGLTGLLPRRANGAGLRRIRIAGRKRDPAAMMVIILLVCLLIYPVASIALRLVTASKLSAAGYTETVERTSAASRYVVSHWTR